ncbi:DUF5677 domain-containing protein [Romboutsia hominis]|uniref:DUF5677 domain-containing protein n=1 Tax=Romboutsia hominis TaxID=1507512 RepID=UPI000B82DA06|nr:DUF5677 domain-containing protein [Romboutsia hominis]
MENKELFKSIMADVNKYVIKNGNPIIILDDHYMREVMTLYAKQHNLIESTLLLLDNNHNEEAYVLARSVLNNYFLIGYLLNDRDGRRLKEYRIQPLLSGIKDLRNIKKALKRPIIKNLEEKGKSLPFTKTDINRKLKELTKKIEDEGFTAKRDLLKIKDIATKSDEKGLELYITFYAQGSKYEHSDISTLDIYKTPVLDDYDKNDVFIMSTDATNENLGNTVYSIVVQSYLDSLFKIIDKITNEDQQLRINFDEDKLSDIFIKATNLLNI